MFKHNIETKTPHSWYSYFVTNVDYNYGVIVEGPYCCGTPLLEVA